MRTGEFQPRRPNASLLYRNGGDHKDLDSAHRVLRKWAQARLGKGDDLWRDEHINGVAKAAIDVIAVTHSLLRQLELATEASEVADERLEALAAAAETAMIGEEHF